ncbi:LuxR C-terminal-related transcriptional regulator [Arthrobacter gengyunqii]|uniref:LuxR C-terminal-related transcriptional regulator n=1 Tax=Arthrobacter gengyunqii TaxID=2886940 RepID=A0A9X1M279_9MICC|nr:LuxR C-terminal-related transcriptional regulator [Arthrobacter gengyunqii]MCC3269641.1 LuxR C-terminal-related transcriptional regulator [Arthrobacter gengyunqii]UOY97101.1 LuxR C-terminal-related transcriptional regulator [Arthrobacter gengyunqii]
MQNSISQSYVVNSSASLSEPPTGVSKSGLLRPAGIGWDDHAPPRFVGRREVTRTILDRLASGGGAGCILVGEPGSGKTALIHHVLRQRSSDSYVVHVRGSAFSGRTPFGALTFLLSDLEPDVATHPVLILRGLSRLIQERAQGRPVLLAVDNGEDLDEFSAMALSQMVLSRTAGLLACFRDFSRAPAEFTGLWREGILSRVDLEPLDISETAELLSLELGGPVSGSAVASLHRHTGGNPHLLTLGCADYRDSGRLRRTGDVWVLDPHKPVPAGQLAKTVLSRLESLTERQLALVRTVALAGSLPLATALHGVEPGEVDTLQEHGILAVEQHSVPRVLLRDPVLAGAVSLSLDAATRGTLLRQLRAALAAGPRSGDYLPGEILSGESLARDASTGESPSGASGPVEASFPGGGDAVAAILDPVRLAQWQLDSGESLDPGTALAAARAANAAGNPACAVRFLTLRKDRKDKDKANSPAAVLELVAARMALGEYGAALAVLSGCRTGDAGVAPVEEIRLLIAENRLLCLAATGALSAEVPAAALPPGAAKKHEELLAKADLRLAELSGAGAISRTDAGMLKRDLVLARAECNSTHGRFLENAAFLAPLQVEAAGQDKTSRLLIGSWLCEALGMTNGQDEAAELIQDMHRLLREPGISRSDRTRAFARILHVHLATGSLEAARRMLEEQAEYSRETRFPGLFGELGEGVLHAYAGDPEAALRCLVPAVAQLRQAGPDSLLPLAASATAYCLALRQNQAGAEAYLRVRDKAVDGGPWTMRRAARHFAALAHAALGSQEAARRFVELAGHDHRRGAYSYELLSLLSAARLGDQDNLERILTVAAHQQGPFARMCETYAKGVGSYDAQLLIQAGELGESAGHVGFAREASERALAVASGAGDRATVRFIHRSRRGTAVSVTEGSDAATEYLSALTFRERSIARMAAAGTSNKAIAAELNISVRTVEGHLYQVYSKLHVGSRRELAKVIADKSEARK